MARKWLRWVGVGLVAAGVAAAVAFPDSAARASVLPAFALYSLSRMVAAYLLSLVFAIAYGTTAATNRRASGIMLPVLDILQSVPILGFFPAALVFFVTTFNGSPFGLELAVVFLIFTSMAWNMAFGVYEAVSSIPHDLEDAASGFGLKEWLRFRRLVLPATIPKLIYNSMLSWANGWFFLVASEIFTAYGKSYTRPGLGAFIAQAGNAGDFGGILLGLGMLAAVVLALDVLVWRPLSVWSEKFRMEGVPGREISRTPGVYERLRWLPRFPRLRASLAMRIRPIAEANYRAVARWDHVYSSHRKVMRGVWRVNLVLFLLILAIVIVLGVNGLVHFFLEPLPTGASDIPAATIRSLARLALAYGVSLAWTIPMAYLIGRSARVSRFLTPAVEVFASIPATALLPLILAFAIAVTSSAGLEAELAAFLITLFAMQWYLLFNLIAGVRAIPGDLDEAARSFGLRGPAYWKRLFLPAIIPSLLTGSITAWGAGWNALIVSEYFQFAGLTYHVQGLGAMMDEATFAADNALLFLTILTMVLVVLAMNKLLWRPLFNRALARFRLEVQ